jgi:hypothetical protein
MHVAFMMFFSLVETSTLLPKIARHATARLNSVLTEVSFVPFFLKVRDDYLHLVDRRVSAKVSVHVVTSPRVPFIMDRLG